MYIDVLDLNTINKYNKSLSHANLMLIIYFHVTTLKKLHFSLV